VIEVQAIRVSVLVAGEELPRDVLPPVGAAGSAQATVRLAFKSAPFPGVEGGEVVAEVNAKAYRRVLEKIDAAPGGAWVTLVGKLAADGVLQQAGFTVRAKEDGGGGTS
jgi:hypothetical protein